ncbi:hypothetical protein GCK32_002683 [Trichostrongylus colubriformis]|uniref:Uncharacterized protein n=1 Tax=Trichostrongylus colubriformis TaxID=6319 RepID=A0AAN8EVN5_TRICO
MQSVEVQLNLLREASEKQQYDAHSIAPGQADAQRHQEQETIEANAEYMEEIDVEEESLETLQNRRDDLETEISYLEQAIEVLEKEKPCEPRSFQGAIFRFGEKNMRCAFVLLAVSTTAILVP